MHQKKLAYVFNVYDASGHFSLILLNDVDLDGGCSGTP